jgi:hypothetical protein
MYFNRINIVYKKEDIIKLQNKAHKGGHIYLFSQLNIEDSESLRAAALRIYVFFLCLRKHT